MSMQPNAARMKNIKKMSRMPVLDSTNSRPSRAISSPARQPSSVDRVSRRAIRHISKMASDPNTALENRQPNEFSPNSHSPTAMSSLPTSGWTTYSPQPAPLHGANRPVVCPCRISWLARLGLLVEVM